MRRFTRAAAYKTKVTGRLSSDVAAAQDKLGLLQISRFDPARNEQRIDSFQFHKNQDFMVLDLLVAVKAHQDPSLAFRASCCEGVCGSCAMNINGINSLACVTYAQKVTKVGPLPNFPVVKDLVVDLKGYFKQYEYIRPYTRNENLQRYHIDTIYARYKEAVTKMLGTEAPEASAEFPSRAAALLASLDSSFEANDVSKFLRTVKELKADGFQVSDEQLAAAIKKMA